MTGLEKIIEQIRADSDEICLEVTRSAENRAKEITDNAKKIAADECEQIKQQTEQRCRYIAERAESGAALERRRALLAAKQEIIGKMLENARNDILKSDNKSYFALLISMLKKYGTKDSCKIAFNSRDLERLPQDFIQKAKEEFFSDIELCKKPADIDGGFILLYGDIEENCSFSAIFSGESEQLSDLASQLLFQN